MSEYTPETLILLLRSAKSSAEVDAIIHDHADAWEKDLQKLAEMSGDYLVGLKKLEETKPTLADIEETHDLLAVAIARIEALENKLGLMAAERDALASEIMGLIGQHDASDGDATPAGPPK